MKLCCPRCGERFAYDEDQAGQKFACRHCRGLILVPRPDELDEASRADYLAEKQKAEARRQKELQREELRRKREEDRKLCDEEQRQQKEAERLQAVEAEEAIVPPAAGAPTEAERFVAASIAVGVGSLLFLGFLVAVCCGFAGLLFQGDDSRTNYGSAGLQDTDDALQYEAASFAEESVRGFTRFPLDATFPATTARRANSKRLWIVDGTVKAKNALGGELTHQWNAWVWHKDGRWALASCTIDDELVFIDQDRLSGGD